jgi:hypothetical protein
MCIVFLTELILMCKPIYFYVGALIRGIVWIFVPIFLQEPQASFGTHKIN